MDEHNQFAQIEVVHRIDVYVEVNDLFRQALNLLKGMFHQDLSSPAFLEYLSKRGNFM